MFVHCCSHQNGGHPSSRHNNDTQVFGRTFCRIKLFSFTLTFRDKGTSAFGGGGDTMLSLRSLLEKLAIFYPSLSLRGLRGWRVFWVSPFSGGTMCSLSLASSLKVSWFGWCLHAAKVLWCLSKFKCSANTGCLCLVKREPASTRKINNIKHILSFSPPSFRCHISNTVNNIKEEKKQQQKKGRDRKRRRDILLFTRRNTANFSSCHRKPWWRGLSGSHWRFGDVLRWQCPRAPVKCR